MKNVDDSKDEWATTEEVAEAMLLLIEGTECAAGRIEGGSILEVGKNQIRFVHERNDPGPTGAGHTLTGNAAAQKGIFAKLLERGWGKSSE